MNKRMSERLNAFASTVHGKQHIRQISFTFLSSVDVNSLLRQDLKKKVYESQALSIELANAVSFLYTNYSLTIVLFLVRCGVLLLSSSSSLVP